jgi:O-antigen/teichoic acid export membrane protein
LEIPLPCGCCLKTAVTPLIQVDDEMERARSRLALGAIFSREHILSLADQGIVSATGFLTTFLIAHWSGSTQLGIYALGLSVLVSAVGFQENLILVPYQIRSFYPEGTAAERAGLSLALCLSFAAAAMLALSTAALGLVAWGASTETIMMTLGIAAIVPFALAREFVRRIAIAHLQMGRALLLDLTVAVIQLSTLAWLGASGRMSALSASFALGAACAVPAVGWLYGTRAEFSVRLRHLRTALRQTWSLGKWLLAGRITAQVQGYAILWLSVAIAGPAIAGVYAACMSVVGFANPLIMGLTNIFLPKSVLAWRHGGGRGLWHEAIWNMALMAAAMTAFSLAVFFAGESVMRILYHGKEFAGLGQTLMVLALATSVGPLGTTAAIALATMQRARAILLATTLEAILTVVLVAILMTKWGLLGAAYGILTAVTIGTISQWIVLYVIVPKNYGPEHTARAFQGTH